MVAVVPYWQETHPIGHLLQRAPALYSPSKQLQTPFAVAPLAQAVQFSVIPVAVYIKSHALQPIEHCLQPIWVIPDPEGHGQKPFVGVCPSTRHFVQLIKFVQAAQLLAQGLQTELSLKVPRRQTNCLMHLIPSNLSLVSRQTSQRVLSALQVLQPFKLSAHRFDWLKHPFSLRTIVAVEQAVHTLACPQTSHPPDPVVHSGATV